MQEPHINFSTYEPFRLKTRNEVGNVNLYIREKTHVLIDHKAHNISEPLPQSDTYRAQLSILSLTGNFNRGRGLFENQTSCIQKPEAWVREKNFTGSALE